MTTFVSVIACTVPASSVAVTLQDECPVGSRVVISTTLEQLTQTADAFDYSYASAVWSLAFTSVVGLYLVAKNAGLILALIRGR